MMFHNIGYVCEWHIRYRETLQRNCSERKREEVKMNKKAVFFHTTPATPEPMKKAFQARYPEDQLITILDDGVLPEVIANQGQPPRSITKKLMAYGSMAQEQGASVFVCMCTTLGIAIREAQKAVDMPMITIDGPMLKEAVEKGEKIGMLITFPPTEKTSKAACLAFAEDIGKDVSVDVIIVEGARAALNEGNKALHDDLIVKKAYEVAGDYDVLVFAQVTMLDAAKRCTDIDIPVLTSVASGVEQLEKYLN